MARTYRDAVVVLTGAGSGIGRELAALLGQRGARLVLVGRRPPPLEETAALVVASGGAAPLPVAADVSVPEQVEALRDRVRAELGGAEVLVNNAGRGAHGPFHEVPLAQHRAVVAANLLGAVHATHAFLPDMLARRRGQLVFVSSVVGELPAPDHAVYGATKFAITGLGESLGHELHGTGVKVTVIEPGLVRSGFQEVAGTPPSHFERLPWKTSAAAAAEALWAMERERPLHAARGRVGLAIHLRRHAPELFRVLYRAAYRRYRGPGPRPDQTERGPAKGR